jgi:hypothetical protein
LSCDYIVDEHDNNYDQVLRWFIELILRTLILPIGRIESNIVLHLREIFFYLPTNVGDKFIMIRLLCPVLLRINSISVQRWFRIILSQFSFCFSRYNFIIWPTLMVILLWSCIMMNKLKYDDNHSLWTW